LALQAIGKTRIRTTLLPPEIAVDRRIRSKKPWAIAAAAGLLLAMGVSTMGSASVLKSYGVEKWDDEQKLVDQVQSEISAQDGAFSAEEGGHAKILENIGQLVAPLEKRSLWMELFKAINECMPYDEGDALDQSDITLQRKLRITSVSAKKVEDVAAWHQKFVDAEKTLDFGELDQVPPTSGKGYIITLKGHHYFNNKEKHDFSEIDGLFVEKTLVANLRKWTLESSGVEVPVGKIGISYPIVAWSLLEREQYDPNRRIGSQMTGAGGYGGGGYAGMGSGMPGEMMGAGAGYMPPGEAGIGAAGYPGGDPAGLGSAGYAGAEGPGAFPGAPGVGGVGTGQIPGGKGPIFKEAEKKELKVIDRTDFVVQFIWIPTVERDRKDADPRAPVSTGTDGAGEPADGAVPPDGAAAAETPAP
jgi:type IV pilus assembly protein PilM